MYYIIELYRGLKIRDNEEKYIGGMICKHRDSVIRNLVEYSSDFKLFNKFAWVANYHNYFCNNYLGRFSKINIDSLLIPDELLNKGIQRL